MLGQHSSLPGHVLYLVYATILASCEDPESAIARLDEAEALLDRPLACLACPTGFHIAAAVACAGAGRIERAGGHLRRAEEHASLWTTGPWPAAMAEARGAIALADGATGEAARLFGEAADGFARWARPLDAARARGRLARVG